MKASRRSLLALLALVLGITATSTWWAGRHEAVLGQQLAALAQPGDIRMLASQDCAFCMLARQWFKRHQVHYSECLIEQEPACRAEFEAQRAAGTPLMLVHGQPQLGFNPERILAALRRGA